MSALVAAGFLLLAAPDDDPARTMLRIAYASLYEWREDKVANATFDFEVSAERQGRKPEDLLRWKAQGSVVIVDGKIERLHIEGPNRDRQGEIRGEMEWALARFVRTPFDEAFKEAKFKGPEQLSEGRHAIHLGRSSWILANDRIVASERNVGTPEEPFRIRVDHKLADVGGGYAILGESFAYKRENVAIEDARTLTVTLADRIPVPEKLTHVAKSFGRASTTEITFRNPRLNEEHPIVLQPLVRDRVKAAWEQRYRIPRGVRIDGEWDRVPGKATVKGGWQRKAYGSFQYLNGELEVIVSEKLRINEGVRKSFRDYGQAHIRAALEMVLEKPFEEEFKGCGFLVDEADPAVVRLLGHPRMLALRIEDGIITAHSEDAFGAVDWWEYRTKKARDGRVLIERMTRRVDDRKWHVKIAYAREGEYYVPRSFEVLVPAQPWGRGEAKEVAILGYDLRKLDVIPPKGE